MFAFSFRSGAHLGVAVPGTNFVFSVCSLGAAHFPTRPERPLRATQCLPRVFEQRDGLGSSDGYSELAWS